MSAPQSMEARELSLVDKVEFRIALADTDAKLQNILNTYLCPLLLKLTSEHKSVRHKVISICHQVLNRIKPQNLRVPVQALLKQFQENKESPLLRHFDLLYVHHGIQRLSKSEQASLVPTLVPGIGASASVSAAHGAKIFNFFIRALINSPLPRRGDPEDTELRATLGATDGDVSFLAFWIGKLFSLKLNVKVVNNITNAPSVSGDEWSFLTVEGNVETWDQNKDGGVNLTTAKLKCLDFISTGFFSDQERLWPVVFAAADSNSNISEPAGDMLKRILPSINLEDATLMEKFFRVYFGYQPMDPGSPNSFVPGASVPVRTRIVGILNRSQISTTFTERILRMLEQDLLQDFQRLNSSSLSDREALKLRSAVLSYIYFVARNAAKTDLYAISRPTIQHLREFLSEQGETNTSPDIRKLRGSSFEIIGNLAASNQPVLLEPNLDILSWLFQSLSGEHDKEVVISIDEALSAVLMPLHRIKDAGIQARLEQLLLKWVKQDSHNARNLRYAAVRFANRCLNFENLHARWIDIISLANSSNLSHETVSEARDGMNPHWHQRLEELESPETKISFPNFSTAIDFLFWEQNAQTKAETSIVALEFCQQALMWTLLASQGRRIDFDEMWDLKLDKMVAEDQEARNGIREQLAAMAADKNLKAELVTFWQCAFSASSSDRLTFSKRTSAAKILVELLAFLPGDHLRQMALWFRNLESGMLSSDEGLRVASAQAYGLLIAHTVNDSSVCQESLSDLVFKVKTFKEAAGRQREKVPGALLGLGFSLSRGRFLDPSNSLFKKTVEDLLPMVLRILGDNDSRQLHEASAHVLGQLSMFYLITPEEIQEHMEWEKIIEVVYKLAFNESSTGISTLAYLSMLLDEKKHSEMLQKILLKMQELHEIKQAETQFTVGEAIVCASIGWRSTVMPPKLDLPGSLPGGPMREQTLEPLLDKLLHECATTTKPSLKKAIVIWMLSFVQFAHQEPEVQSRLRKMQAVFRRCLADRDEFVQESASRGLSLVYEKGDPLLKEELINDLLGSFSSEKAEVSGTVTQDTQLFEPGAMRTEEGSSVNTYKDIMSLASEMGDSSLVYRFMSLASHDAIWSSRTAFGRFGLSNLFSEAQAEGRLASNPKLFAKLYRYRFDPNSKVRRSMDEIWNSLVKDSNNTLNTHFDAILDDLLVNVLGKEWRTREASCEAIAALIQTVKVDKILPHNERLWTCVFKVLDDIKDSVRKAALRLVSRLLSLVSKSLEADDGRSEVPQKMLESSIPFLFGPSGAGSKAELSGALASVSIFNLIRHAKPDTLRPFVPELVENLLNLLAEQESAKNNYAQLAAESLNISAAEIDTKRAAAVRASPMIEVIEKCLGCLDEKTMQGLSKTLQSAIKSAIAIPTKIGCSHVLISLSVHQRMIFKPYTDKFLDLVPRYLTDRSEAVASSYAISLGYIARGASNEGIAKLASRMRDLYFDSEAEKSRTRAGDVLHALAKFASDKFVPSAEVLVPLMFFGEQDQDEEVRRVFASVRENSGIGARTILLHLNEIVELTKNNIRSRRWVIKHSAAVTISALIKEVTNTKGQMSLGETDMVWPVLETALAEKSWDGKEKILPGLVAFAKYRAAEKNVNSDIAKGNPQIGNAPTVLESTLTAVIYIQIALREAKRRNRNYQSFAIDSLAKITAYVGESELSSDSILGVVEAIISEFSEDSETSNGKGREPDLDSEENSRRNRAMTGAIDAIFAAIKVRKGQGDQADKDPAMVPRGLDLASKANATSHFQRAVQSQLLVNLKSFFEDLQAQARLRYLALEPQDAGNSFLPKAIEDVVFAPHAAMATAPESFRVQRSEAVLAFAELYKRSGGAVPPVAAFAIRASAETSELARQNLLAAAEILETL